MTSKSWHCSWEVNVDAHTRAIAPSFDGSSGHPDAHAPSQRGMLDFTKCSPGFSIMIVLGPTGSGKTNTLHDLANHYGIKQRETLEFASDVAVASHPGFLNPDGKSESIDYLSSCGLNKVPSWCRPFHVLSNGEQSRVQNALALAAQTDGILLDDFAAVVDDQQAKSMAASLARVVKKKCRRVIVATTKPCIVQYIQPDFLVFAKTGEIVANPRSADARRTTIKFEKHITGFARGKDSSGWLGDTAAEIVRAESAQHAGTVAIHGGKSRPDLLQSEQYTCSVRMDAAVEAAANAFEFEFDGQCEDVVHSLRREALDGPPFEDFVLGAVVGPSGSGKSITLRRLGMLPKDERAASGANGSTWEASLAVCSQLGASDAQELRALLAAADLSAAAALRPYWALSRGEQAKAEIARSLGDAARPVVFLDEFTSTLDRTAARRVCKGLADYLQKAREDPTMRTVRVVVAGIHEDVVASLAPDWLLETRHSSNGAKLSFFDKTLPCLRDQLQAVASPQRGQGQQRCLKRNLSQADGKDAADAAALFAPATIALEVFPVASGQPSRDMYAKHFSAHHYLRGTPPTCLSGLVVRTPAPESKLVAFHGVAPQFGASMGTITNRESRLVILPEWQGFGLGPRLSELVGEELLARGYRYFSKTCHPRLGLQRVTSPLWKPTSGNGKISTMTISGVSTKPRSAWAHQFVGQEGGDGNDSLVKASELGPRGTRPKQHKKGVSKKRQREEAAMEAAAATPKRPKTCEDESDENNELLLGNLSSLKKSRPTACRSILETNHVQACRNGLPKGFPKGWTSDSLLEKTDKTPPAAKLRARMAAWVGRRVGDVLQTGVPASQMAYAISKGYLVKNSAPGSDLDSSSWNSPIVESEVEHDGEGIPAAHELDECPFLLDDAAVDAALNEGPKLEDASDDASVVDEETILAAHEIDECPFLVDDAAVDAALNEGPKPEDASDDASVVGEETAVDEEASDAAVDDEKASVDGSKASSLELGSGDEAGSPEVENKDIARPAKKPRASCQRVECSVCGGSYNNKHRAEHLRTKKHQTALATNERKPGMENLLAILRSCAR